jgi:hypothetical protein
MSNNIRNLFKSKCIIERKYFILYSNHSKNSFIPYALDGHCITFSEVLHDAALTNNDPISCSKLFTWGE